VSQVRPCPKCRGYDLERRWCGVCDSRGVVEVEDDRPSIKIRGSFNNARSKWLSGEVRDE